MSQTPYIFNQLISFIPRKAFDWLVTKHNGNAYVKNYTCWSHLLVMLWAQLTSRCSLRDLETSLHAHSDKLYRMGIGLNVSRNNIANSNAKRNVAIYRGIAERMMDAAARLGVRDAGLARVIRDARLQGLFAIDSSSVSLELGKSPWSIPQEGVGGVKFHTMYDLLRQVPRMCLVTGHEERDQTFMADYPYEKGCLYVFDKAYMKVPGMSEINRKGAYFVVRRKSNVRYDVLRDLAPIGGKLVVADRVIRFPSRWSKAAYPQSLRMVSFYGERRNELLEFLTNNFDLPAESVALIYKERWQIENFFKWVKQHLRVTCFYGNSANAVMMQIYIAITAYCLLAIAAEESAFDGSLYDFMNLLSVSLTERIWLKELVARYKSARKEEEKLQKIIWPSLFPDFDKMIVR